MEIIIHRGADQIGGCVTEIRSGNSRLIIDFGSNLEGSERQDYSQEEIDRITEGVDAIFYTHYHGDHTGMHYLVNPKVSQYIGKGAKEVMRCKYNALKRVKDCSREMEALTRMKTYEEKKPIIVGKDLKVTPYFVSHSAFDAYMFKVEAEGRKILHTGDFRTHGFLGKGLEPVLRWYVGEVDVLITEGTMLGRTGEKVVSENEIKHNVIEALRKHKYVFALCSSTDIDRLASFHQACQEAHRNFVVDNYQASVLEVFSKYAGTHARLFDFKENEFVFRTSNEKIAGKFEREGFLAPIRMQGLHKIGEIMKGIDGEDPWLIYSMWGGYAQNGKSYSKKEVQQIRSLFEGRILDGTKDGFHTSGHADPEALRMVCEITRPRLGIIAIHKDKDTDFGSLFTGHSFNVFKPGITEMENVKVVIK